MFKIVSTICQWGDFFGKPHYLLKNGGKILKKCEKPVVTTIDRLRNIDHDIGEKMKGCSGRAHCRC